MRHEMHLSGRKRQSQAGMTLLELILACGILMVLATSALPVARFTVKREKEAELRRDLREMRDAIDRYKDAADRNLIRVEVGTEGYPPDLETLVNGVDLAAGGPGTSPAQVGTPAATIAGRSGGVQPGAGPTGLGQPGGATTLGSAIGSLFGAQTGNALSGNNGIRHVRFLRRIPTDPMTGQAMWGMRSVQDDTDSTSWGGKDVFDVFSMSGDTALDGTRYGNW